ncbi:MAG: RluA family pseudouridine synthase [Pseudomonadota bacterium]
MESTPEKIYPFLISHKDRDQRLDTFLAYRVPDLTRSRIQNLIKNGFVKINGDRLSKTSYRLKRGDHVELVVPPPLKYTLEPETIDFTPVYEDHSIIVLNKPSGLVIHPAPGHRTGTLVHGLLQHCKDLSGIGGVLRPGIVHRLDKDTSGLMVVAKNDNIHRLLAEQFKSGTVKKRYIAVVHGIIRGERGKIDLPIARHPKKRKAMSVLLYKGRRSVTFWEKIGEFRTGFSLLSVTPKTGRTHQIRVHLSYSNHPIVGDMVYGSGYKQGWWKRHFPQRDDLLAQIRRQMLHAETLGFIHPHSNRYCEFKAPIPEDMATFLKTVRLMDLEWKRE